MTSRLKLQMSARAGRRYGSHPVAPLGGRGKDETRIARERKRREAAAEG